MNLALGGGVQKRHHKFGLHLFRFDRKIFIAFLFFFGSLYSTKENSVNIKYTCQTSHPPEHYPGFFWVLFFGCKAPNGTKQGSIDIFLVNFGMGLGQKCIPKGVYGFQIGAGAYPLSYNDVNYVL